MKTTVHFYPPLKSYIEGLIAEADRVSEDRRAILDRLASYVRQKHQKDERVALNFICTHNSRRSQLSQVWAATAASWFGLDQLEVFSGGTEATAFNPRAVAALERAGFQIQKPEGENPHYLVAYAEEAQALECFSKTYDDPFNPQDHIAAIMTCSDADENCPFIPGVELRLPLTYDDPKEADDTPEETARYDERTRQIGRELLYAMRLIAQSKPQSFHE